MRMTAKCTPTRFYGRSHVMYGLTQFICARPYITHGLPNMWQYSRIYERPRYCVVSHDIAVVAHNTACTPTTVCGCATIVANGHPGKI